MKTCILLKPYEAAALAEGRTITVWRPAKEQPQCYSHEHWPETPDFKPHFNKDGSVCCGICMGKNQRLRRRDVTGIPRPLPVDVALLGKETWADVNDHGVEAIKYRADDYVIDVKKGPNFKLPAWADKLTFAAWFEDEQDILWHPAGHMPADIVRTKVTLSNVHFRKPSTITDEDEAAAMGIPPALEPPNLKAIMAARGLVGWCPHMTEFRGIIEDTDKDGWDKYWWSYTATPQPA